MDSDADPLSITLLFIVLIIIDFLLSAFTSAIDNGGLSICFFFADSKFFCKFNCRICHADYRAVYDG